MGNAIFLLKELLLSHHSSFYNAKTQHVISFEQARFIFSTILYYFFHVLCHAIALKKKNIKNFLVDIIDDLFKITKINYIQNNSAKTPF